MSALAEAKQKKGASAKRGRPKGDGPNPVDIHVGSRVRLRRTLLGMSQEKLAQAIGLTFQQIQKYERGANRIGASRLHELSQVLDVPVSFFFDDMTYASSGDAVAGALHEETPPPFEGDPLTKRETLRLVRAYYRIKSPALRKRIFDLTQSLADEEDAGES
ncbi:MAG: helix-turn-helix domain-containing protein [Alphaproteobacteria bacterium]|nr:helix-turn-helix domain-containing protein [Alphaproteobacteria bacterium]